MNQLRHILVTLLSFLTVVAQAEDWPTYLHDNARSGITAAAIQAPLAERWVVRSPVEPRTAWPPPQPGWTELPKVDFDDAFYTVADRDTVYFASSVENKVVAVEAATGVTRWEVFASAPVRLAPTLSGEFVYFGADDGRVVCARRETGEVEWTFDAAPQTDWVLGNGRVMSPWPVRTGILVVGDRVYFGSGVFPYHRVFLFALNAATGELIWKRDDLTTYGGFSPQGYLLANRDRLVVMSGRASPIVVNSANGDLLFGIPHSNEKGGATGVHGVIADDVLFVGTQNTLWGTNLVTEKSGGAWLNSAKVVLNAEHAWLLRGPPAPAYGRKSISSAKNEIACLDRAAYRALPRKDAESVKQVTRWRFQRPDLASLIVAGPHLIAGGLNEVFCLDAQTGKVAWEGKVDGHALGLTVAHGRLLVSTSTGAVHCFSSAPTNSSGQIDGATRGSVNRSAEVSATKDRVRKLASDTLRSSAVRRGYAVVIGDDAAALGCELARQSELSVTCVVFDSRQVSEARQFVAAAGLYGHRVTVELAFSEIQKETDASAAPNGSAKLKLPFPDYGANLVVAASASSLTAVSGDELLRVTKPCGGVLLATGVTEIPPTWRDAGEVALGVTIGGDGKWTKLVRGTLPGSGWWTHQFADAGGSGSSRDKLVKGRLEVLWFGEPGADEFPDRHQRGPAPLVHNGRVYCQGWNFLERQTTLFCFDAYNGVRYWKRGVSGEIRLGLPAVAGNLACDDNSVYIAAGSVCTRYSAATGETLATFQTPPRADGTRPDWAYLAVSDGLVVGSSAEGVASRFSDRLFAFEVASGKQRWDVRPRETRDTTIAIQRGRLFFVDNRQPPLDDAGRSKLKQLLSEGQAAPYPRTVVAIELATGKTAWERDVELIDCGRWENSMWGSLQMLCDENTVVLAGAYTIYPTKVPQRPRRALALSTADGRELWNTEIGNRSRPVMMHEALLAEPVFHDLKTGEKILKPRGNTGKQAPWSMGPRTGGCGSLSASDCMVFGRGGYTVWRDVDGGPSGAFVGMRPGCFINIIPAGGVVVQAEASSGCSCYQAVQCTVVLKPVAK